MQKRKANYPILPFILQRWSSRAMTGQEITDEELMTMFEAARWAESSFNNQPWRFVYAHRETDYWNSMLDLLVEGNKIWAKNAAVLMVILSRRVFDYNNKPSRTHSFDAGAALQNLALQGTSMGFVVHAMEGFDYDKARTVIAAPNDYAVEVMVAIGNYGNLESLPQELQKKDFPSERKSLAEISFEGKFQKF